MKETQCFVVDDNNRVIAQGVLVDFVSKVYNCPQSHVLIRIDTYIDSERVEMGIFPKETVFYMPFLG